jgi:hypothetical protein
MRQIDGLRWISERATTGRNNVHHTQQKVLAHDGEIVIIAGQQLGKLCTSGFTLHYYEAEGLAR